MSLTSLPTERKKALERQKLAITTRIRRNFWLKFISLATAVTLYFYVQAERNPNVTHPFTTPVFIEHRPEMVEVQADVQKVKVNISGPRSVLDVLKENEIRVSADFTGTPVDKVSQQRLRCHYDLIGAALEHRAEISFDPPEPARVTVMVFPRKTMLMSVSVHYLREAPAGFRYSPAEVSPQKVKVSGRLDRMDRIERLVVNAVGGESGVSIEGDFAVSARDANGNPVEEVTLTPPSVHVTIPLAEEPYSKIVSISPDIHGSPLAGYTLDDVQPTPMQVRIIGTPAQVTRIATILTGAISIKDRMADLETDAPLIIPIGITVRALDNTPVQKVHVRVSLKRLSTPIVQPTIPEPVIPIPKP